MKTPLRSWFWLFGATGLLAVGTGTTQAAVIVTFGATVTQATNTNPAPTGYIPVNVGDKLSGNFTFDTSLAKQAGGTTTQSTYVYSQLSNTHAISFTTSPINNGPSLTASSLPPSNVNDKF